MATQGRRAPRCLVFCSAPRDILRVARTTSAARITTQLIELGMLFCHNFASCRVAFTAEAVLLCCLCTDSALYR